LARLKTLCSIVRNDRKTLLKATGQLTPFVPSDTIHLSGVDLAQGIVRGFILKYAFYADEILEGKVCWGESIWLWLQSMETWNAQDLIMNARFHLEVWSKDEADYYTMP
jgi:hypothetical protein